VLRKHLRDDTVPTLTPANIEAFAVYLKTEGKHPQQSIAVKLSALSCRTFFDARMCPSTTHGP